MPKKIPTGTVLQLGERLRSVSRRRFLKGVASLAAGSIGLSTLVKRAYGKKPDGRVLVYTDDRLGNPDTVKIVSKERYRRLKLYEQLPVDKLVRQRRGVNAVTITQRSDDPDDLALKFLLDRNTNSVRKRVPNTYNRMPVVVEERPRQSKPEALEGGSAIDYDQTSYNGTAALVGYDGDGNQAIVTADHVMEEAQTMYSGGDEVGTFSSRDVSIDVTAYTRSNNASTNVGGTKSSSVSEITGAWKFAGLADKVGQTDDGDSVSDGDTVSVDHYGATSGHISDKCNNTKRTGQIEYQADMVHHYTDGGDSGGPWVDDNGKLLGVHHGYDYDSDLFGGYTEWSTAAVGRPALDAVGVSLSK